MTDIQDIKRIRLAPNEVLVIRVPRSVSMEQRDRIKAVFTKALPDHDPNKITVGPEEVDFEVITPTPTRTPWPRTIPAPEMFDDSADFLQAVNKHIQGYVDKVFTEQPEEERE